MSESFNDGISRAELKPLQYPLYLKHPKRTLITTISNVSSSNKSTKPEVKKIPYFLPGYNIAAQETRSQNTQMVCYNF
jgi:hypothetical protein